MSIAFVTPRFGESVGGVETHVREVGRRLVASGHRVVVVAGDEIGRLPRHDEIDGIDVRRVAAWPRGRDWQVAPGIVLELARLASDIVHVQSIHTAVAPIALTSAAVLRRGPLVVTFHSGGHSSAVRRRLRTLHLLALRPLIRRADQLVAVSAFERDELASRLRLRRSRFVVIANGADVGGPSPGRPAMDGESDLALGRRDRVILSVGRLERYKRHDQVIRALPLVRRRIPDATLRIVGRGPDEGRLRALAMASGVGDAVQFTEIPFDDRPAMRDELRTASVVALLSEYESQGIAAFEAIASGVPVVVADATAYHELVVRGLAMGVAPGSTPAAVAQAVVRAMASRPPAALSIPTWDATATALERLYRSLLDQHQANRATA